MISEAINEAMADAELLVDSSQQQASASRRDPATIKRPRNFAKSVKPEFVVPEKQFSRGE